MKREAFRHPKMADVANRLGVEITQAIGILELLWDYAADYAPQGNIGRWSNAVIANACMWKGDPDSLVNALVESGWVDRCSVHRLVVHDLEDHAQAWWKSKLSTLGLSFIKAVSATDQTVIIGRSSPDDRAIQTEPNRTGTEPNQTITKPRVTGTGRAPAGVFGYVREETLRNTGKLLDWLGIAVAAGMLTGSEEVRLNVIAAAERALELGKKPAAMFVTIVRGAKWELITDDQEDRANQRLRDYHRAANGHRPEVEQLAEKFAPDPETLQLAEVFKPEEE